MNSEKLVLIILALLTMAFVTDETVRAGLQKSKGTQCKPGKWCLDGFEVDDIGPILPAPRPLTDKEALGKILFFDQNLGVVNKWACARCHKPDYKFADNTRHETRGKHNTLTLLNVAMNTPLMWDGHFKILEEQAEAVFLNKHELGATPESVAQFLESCQQYKDKFTTVFHELSLTAVTQAIASFERTLTSNGSPFDY